MKREELEHIAYAVGDATRILIAKLEIAEEALEEIVCWDHYIKCMCDCRSKVFDDYMTITEAAELALKKMKEQE
jgi:hypothetical protein